MDSIDKEEEYDPRTALGTLIKIRVEQQEITATILKLEQRILEELEQCDFKRRKLNKE